MTQKLLIRYLTLYHLKTICTIFMPDNFRLIMYHGGIAKTQDLGLVSRKSSFVATKLQSSLHVHTV